MEKRAIAFTDKGRNVIERLNNEITEDNEEILNQKLNEDLDNTNDVYEDIDLDSVPLNYNYANRMIVYFNDGRITNIELLFDGVGDGTC